MVLAAEANILTNKPNCVTKRKGVSNFKFNTPFLYMNKAF
jgi:hypothetical protein